MVFCFIFYVRVAKGDDFDCNFETQCWLADDSKRWVIGKNTPSENTGPDVDHTFLSGRYCYPNKT